MAEENHRPPGLLTLVRQLGATGLGALRNRAELFSVEWQEERARLSELVTVTLVFGFFAVLGMGLLTATIIYLIPAEYRIYGLAGFTLLYLAGALWAWFAVKALLRHEPFAETADQLAKDRVWLESFK